MKSRNLTLEKLVGMVKYPCRYEDLGCTGLFSLECLASHQENCPHETRRCPFEVLDTHTCTWEGKEAAVVDDMKTIHSDICGLLNREGEYETRLWDIERGPVWYRAIFKQNDVFVMNV
jgi:hypothetical protein